MLYIFTCFVLTVTTTYTQYCYNVLQTTYFTTLQITSKITCRMLYVYKYY